METHLATSAFDGVADRYDVEFTDTAVGRALRSVVWSRLVTVFRPSQRILELGCGTGEDAIRLAMAGMSVVATDPSPAFSETKTKYCALTRTTAVTGTVSPGAVVQRMRARTN